VANILVVDDERAVRVALDVNLSKAGHTVALADTGEHLGGPSLTSRRSCAHRLDDAWHRRHGPFG